MSNPYLISAQRRLRDNWLKRYPYSVEVVKMGPQDRDPARRDRELPLAPKGARVPVGDVAVWMFETAEELEAFRAEVGL